MLKINKFLKHRIVLPGSPPRTSFWTVAWSILMACAWLLPNHFPPWEAFHADAYAATILVLTSVAAVTISRTPVKWSGLTVLLAMLLPIPWLQYSAGMMPFSGQAWITTAYLLGLLVALLTGYRWEQARSNQVIDGLFLATGIASIVSVNLQLQTWLGLIDTGIFDLWSMGLAGDRPYANMGQPNQLATLLLWGLLACFWAYSTRKIRPFPALLMTGFLLVGIALTQSRTAWLGLTLIVAFVWIWRRHWHSRWVPWAITGLFVFFWFCPLLLRELSQALLLSSEQNFFREPLQGELRPLAWRLFLGAVLERPWLGYGWREVGHAQLGVATNFPALHATFGHAHNLFLDLVLWLGLPIGLFVSGALVWWFVSSVRAVSDAKDAILILFVGVIGIHAMLELPLHYAYFLLPTGLVLGVLNQRLGKQTIWTSPRWTLAVLWLASALLLSGIVRDYFRVESSFQALRFELARIGTLPPGQPPDVLLLTQLREEINFLRYKAKSGMSSQELEWVQQVGSTYPGGGVLYKVATALALNGRPDESLQWLKKICKISSVEECELIKRVWSAESRNNPLIAAVPWPG
jgi:O-antigen ligase